MKDEANGRILKTTRMSLRVLELVLEHDGLTLARLAELIDKPKSSLHSHLQTLLNARYLVKNDNTYRVSFRVSLLGEMARQQRLEDSRVRGIVEELAAETGEEANFVVLEHGRLLMAYGASGDSASEERNVDFRTEYYLHNTAAGKAILAEMEPARVDRVLDRWHLPQESESTIQSRERLLESQNEVLSRGYGISDEESAPGLVTVGVAIHRSQDIIGGLSVGGPKYRISMDRLHTEFADTLLEKAAALENQLEQ
ncbi:IclR family transcriptional regulator [Halococcus sp. IIIV-5B]|nr:IclR family transcriptional regulator [Halococcus sp. IIIV-5B]